MTPLFRPLLPIMVAAVALATPALAQPRGGPGGFGGRGFGPGPHRPGAYGAPSRIGARFQQRFQRANSSHDGRLTQAQARDGNMPVIARHFDEIDTDHKGYVTMDQVQSYREQMTQRRHAAQGGPGGPGPDDQEAPPQ